MSPEKNAYNKLLQEYVLSSCMDRSGLHINPRVIAQKAQDPMLVMNIFGSTLPRALYDRQGRLQQEILLRLLSTLGLTIEDFEKMLEGVAERELALNLFNLATPVTEKELEVLALKSMAHALLKWSHIPSLDILKMLRLPEHRLKIYRLFMMHKMANQTATGSQKNGKE